MRVETGLSKLPAWMKRDSASAKKTEGKPAPKTLGDVPPVVEKLENHPDLAEHFTHYGLLQKLRRKLKQLSGQDAKIVLAKNTVAAADNKGVVYIGVEFLRENWRKEALIAAVLAHEWGHLISNMTKLGSLDHLSWDEIFALRKDEEAAADTFCGRMLAMMGYSPDPICEFLKSAEKASPTVKYYAAPIRAAIIQEAFRLHSQRKAMTKKLFPKRTYANPYTSRIILADE
ncbi:MAG: hypothetical protein R3257_00180 [bacterium]|nr:hypothetical protein [bacterium]